MSARAWIVVIVIIVLLIGGVLYFSGRNAAGPNPGDLGTSTGGTASSTASSTAVRGTITNIDRGQAASGGPTLLTLQTADGRTVTVAVPSGSQLSQCAAKNNIEDVTTMRAGMEVEVSGALDPSGRIAPCQSPDDYLLVATK